MLPSPLKAASIRAFSRASRAFGASLALRVPSASFLALGACVTAACVGTIGPGSDDLSATNTADGGKIAPTALLPARVRRLSNAEFDASAQALLGTKLTFASAMPVDVRQGSYNAGGFPAAGFTRNAGAIFDSVSTPQVQQAADALAQEAIGKVTTIAPCPAGQDWTGCATSFIASFGPKAYRRPLTADEKSGLLAVWQAGEKDQDFNHGIQLVITTILQSAGFLYLTELGGKPSGGAVKLTSYEVASELSYFLTGGPPDDTLLAAAAADGLQDPGAVGLQATRLLNASMGQLATFVEQWLGVDSPPGTSTGTMVSSADMVGETTAFIEDVMQNGGGSLSSLFTAPYTFIDAPLATLYGLPASSVTGTGFSKVQGNGQRVGVLNQASFLTTYAHSSFSAPIKRGHMVRTQLLCDQIPPPDPSLMVNTTPPLPTTVQTTRQADSEHMTSPACASCHQLMDPIGWAFENFDGNGAYRTTEAGIKVDSSGSLNSAGDLSGPFTTGSALLKKLAVSKAVEQCYWQHFADFAAAVTDPTVESAFMKFWAAQPAAVQESLPKIVLAYVQSDLFLKRAAQ